MKNTTPHKLTALLFGALVALCLGGCNTIEPRLVHTTSGKPEAIIAAPVADIKGAIIADMINHGYTVDSDSNYMLRLSRARIGDG